MLWLLVKDKERSLQEVTEYTKLKEVDADESVAGIKNRVEIPAAVVPIETY